MPSAAPDLGYGRHPRGDKPGLLQTSMRWACKSGDVSTRRLSTVGQDLIAALAVAALARVATPLCGLSFKPAFVVFPHSANLGRVRILTSTFCSATPVSACMPTPALFSAHFQLRLRPPPPAIFCSRAAPASTPAWPLPFRSSLSPAFWGCERHPSDEPRLSAFPPDCLSTPHPESNLPSRPWTGCSSARSRLPPTFCRLVEGSRVNSGSL